MRTLLGALAAVLVGGTALGQGPKETVWVLQDPPFGTIASLAGIPELSSAYPMAGPLHTDVRLSERRVGIGSEGSTSRFVRLTQTGDKVDGALYLWWFGQPAHEPPASLPKRCTQPREGPGVCVLPLPPVQHDWPSLLRDVLTADVCPGSRLMHAYELRVQVFERMPYPKYRASELCEPIATRLGTLIYALAPNDFRGRK